jgi:hypothetical protein
MLAQLARIALDPSPCSGPAAAICIDLCSEVIAQGIAISHMDRYTFPDREEGREAQLGHTLNVALRVPTDVLVHERVDAGSRSPM